MIPNRKNPRVQARNEPVTSSSFSRDEKEDYWKILKFWEGVKGTIGIQSRSAYDTNHASVVVYHDTGGGVAYTDKQVRSIYVHISSCQWKRSWDVIL